MKPLDSDVTTLTVRKYDGEDMNICDIVSAGASVDRMK